MITDVRSGVTTAYTYNKRNRLATVTVGGNLKGTYTYNAREQLVKRVLTNMTPSGTTHFVHDLMGNVIAETNGVATGTVREYVWLPETQIAPVMAARAQVDRPLAVVDAVNTASPVMWWVHPDHLNRPVLMTNAAKAQVWQAVWKPFGEAQSLTGPAALDTRFPGQWFQIESGLHYNWHRHYDPTTGRYTQPDPLGFVDGPGVYGYSGAKSLGFVDQLGLWSVDISVFVGLGGTIGFGSSDGVGWASINFGVGLGGGWDYDPEDKVPLKKPECLKPGVYSGFDMKENAGFGWGPLVFGFERRHSYPWTLSRSEYFDTCNCEDAGGWHNAKEWKPWVVVGREKYKADVSAGAGGVVYWK